jgi:hypothetical protein
MATTAASKYAENQFDAATANSFTLMSEFAADMLARVLNSTEGIDEFTPKVEKFTTLTANFHDGAQLLAMAEAALPACTEAFVDKLASLTRKPDVDTNSILDSWEHELTGEVTRQGPTYMKLLPSGRGTLTSGSLTEQVDSLERFAMGLEALGDKPKLAALGSTVAAFHSQVVGLREAQLDAKSKIETAYTAQETLRKQLAAAMYGVVGQGMAVWSETPERVDDLFDVNILRHPPQAVPAAPADTKWDAVLRSLSTTILPDGATRLEAWRQGPGGMPELLQTGSKGATNVIIPATITFTPGKIYQLWLVALNSKGRSEPGPVQEWTAP